MSTRSRPPARFQWRRLIARFREYLEFDSRIAKASAGYVGTVAGIALFTLGAKQTGLAILMKIHRSAVSTDATSWVERFLGLSKHDPRRGGTRLARCLEQIRGSSAPTESEFPRRLLGTRWLVVKSPRDQERGMLILDYSYTFPIFARHFDLARVASRYDIVLEPSWSGYCDLDILSYSKFDFPVFVESAEPRDTDLISRMRSNLVPVPLAANWWVDHRVMRPLPDVSKDIDLIYVAAWARYKRHDQLLNALSRLKRRGEQFRVLLAGYPRDMTKDDIFALVKAFSLQSVVEIHEKLTPEQVNLALNRSKASILWSRREGFNRAIIESLFAGTPCILRSGFNYGHTYSFVNPRTGVLSTEAGLPDTLNQMRDTYQNYAPREWAMENMTCQLATRILGATIRRVAERRGDAWTAEPVVKVGFLNWSSYWDPADRDRFAADYDYLRDSVR